MGNKSSTKVGPLNFGEKSENMEQLCLSQGFTTDECKSLMIYKGSGYGQINRMLRTENIDKNVLDNASKEYTKVKNRFKFAKQGDPMSDLEILLRIKNIDSAMRKNHITSELYRGISSDIIPNVLNSENKLLIEKGYSSTSISKENLLSYVNEDGCCGIKFHLPDDIDSYIYPEKKTSLSYEGEILLQRNIVFKLSNEVEIYKINGKNIKIYDAKVFKIDEIKKYVKTKVVEELKNGEELVINRIVDNIELDPDFDEISEETIRKEVEFFIERADIIITGEGLEIAIDKLKDKYNL